MVAVAFSRIARDSAGHDHIDEHCAVFELDSVAIDLAFVWGDGATRIEIDASVVQRASDALPEHDALRERPAPVRTAVGERKELAVRGPENCDVGPDTLLYDPRAKSRNIIDCADAYPSLLRGHRVKRFMPDAVRMRRRHFLLLKGIGWREAVGSAHRAIPFGRWSG
jgi:hypothetical protein